MTSESGHTESAALRPGMTLDKYQLVEVIGTGGSSVVWKAVESLLGRTVAIKELTRAAPVGDAEQADQFRQRVQQEIELHRRLAQACPKIVQLHDAIVDERGAFLVMEYVEGPSLAQVLAQHGKAMTAKYVIFVLRAVAQAVAQLHGQGVVHRDLKPGNILLPDAGGVKLCDLGLAAMIADQEALTLGSVRYMAPELCRGEQADERADVYSLGMIAYEMLAGPAGFDHAFRSVVRDQSRQAMRWIKWHTNMRLAPPPLKEINEQVPSRLSDLVARMLEKDPVQRVRSAEELVAAIERNFSSREARQAGLAPGGPAIGAGTSQVLSAPKEHDTAALPQRKRWPAAVAAVLAVAVAGGVGWFAYDSHQHRTATAARVDDAREQFAAARQHYFAGEYDQARPLFAALLADWPSESTVGQHAQAGLMLVDIQQHLLAGAYDSAREVYEEVEAFELEHISRQELYELRSHIEGRRAFDRQVEAIREHIAGGELGQASRNVSDLRNQPRSNDENRILDELETRIGERQQDHRAAMILDEVQDMVTTGDVEGAIDRLRDAQRQRPHTQLEARLAALRDQHGYAQAIRRAQAARDADDLAAAVAAYDDALAIRDDAAVQRTRRDLQAEQQYRRGRQLIADGRTAEGRAALEQAVALNEHGGAQSLLAESDTRAQREALVRAGDDAFAQRDFAAAQQHYTAALRIGQDEDVQNRLAQAQLFREVERVQTHMAAGEFDAATAGMERLRGRAVDDQALADEIDRLNRRLAYWRHIHAGDAEYERQEYGEARRAYQRAQQLFDDDVVSERIDVATFDDLLAQARRHMAAQEWRVAEAMLQTARRIRDTQEARELLEEVQARRESEDG